MSTSLGYLDIVEIFKQIATMHPDINQFVHFDTDKLEASTRSNITYPCLFLTLPSFNGDAYLHEFEGPQVEVTFAILDRATTTLNMEAQALHTCSLIAQDVIHQLSYSDRFTISKWSSEPLQNFISDNTHGYDINITLDCHQAHCREIFQHGQIFDSILKFELKTGSSIAPGQIATIAVTSNHPLFTLAVATTINGVTTTASTIPSSITLGTGEHVITVTATHPSGYSFKRKLTFTPAINRTYFSTIIL